MSAPSAFRRGSALAFPKTLAIGFLAGGLSVGCCLAADPGADPAESVSQAIQQVFKQAESSVVKIEALDREDKSPLVGTGFFVDPNGMVYTAYTVGGDTQGIVISFGDKKYPATRLLGDPRSGIAILKIDAHTPFLRLAKDDDLAVNMPVLVIGYPMNLPLMPSLGLVAGLDSKNDDGYFVTKHIRANVAVKPGQPGSPMLNLKGEVVGIVISEDSGSSCYALPTEAVAKVRSDYERFGDIHHGWIGISVTGTDTLAGGSNVVVSRLIEDTPAAKSGLQTGDVVLQIGNKKISEPEDVLNASFFLTAGDEVPITVQRGDQKITVKVLAASEEQPPMRAPMNASGEGTPTEGHLQVQP